MAEAKKTKKKPIEQYDHKGKKRLCDSDVGTSGSHRRGEAGCDKALRDRS